MTTQQIKANRAAAELFVAYGHEFETRVFRNDGIDVQVYFTRTVGDINSEVLVNIETHGESMKFVMKAYGTDGKVRVETATTLEQAKMITNNLLNWISIEM